jgi:RNA polymerase sigma factor (sigma-70 family)
MEDIIFLQKTKTNKTDFVKLYKEVFPQVAKYVGGKGGSLSEAKDVFQDALIIYFEKIKGESPVLQKGSKEYIIGIAKKLWINRYRQKIKDKPIEESYDFYLLNDETSGKINDSILIGFLEKSGKKCMDMLQAFYYKKLSLTEIAHQFGFSGVRSATVQKYKCIEKVRDKIKEKSLSYEDFIE